MPAESTPPAVRREGANWRLDGVLAVVPAAMAAQWLLLPVQAGGERLLLAVALDAAGVARQPRVNHDATRPVARTMRSGMKLPALRDAICTVRPKFARTVNPNRNRTAMASSVCWFRPILRRNMGSVVCLRCRKEQGR